MINLLGQLRDSVCWAGAQTQKDATGKLPRYILPPIGSKSSQGGRGGGKGKGKRVELGRVREDCGGGPGWRWQQTLSPNPMPPFKLTN